MLNKTDLSRADLNLLTLFEVVLKERHVGRAAQRLNLSPSAVSHGLGRMRKLLNDPVFLRTPKGVVPTARALELAGPVADILARVRNVISTAEPFDASKSSRRFVIGAPDGISSVFMPPLLTLLRSRAPNIDIGLRQLLPPKGGRQIERAWEPLFDDLDAAAVDIAIAPVETAPTRFAAEMVYREDFVAVMRSRHPFAVKPTLERFCEMRHLVVSMTGDAYGFVDEALAAQGLARRVALTVPNFAMGLVALSETDLISAMPRRYVAMHGKRLGLASRELPLHLPAFPIRAIAPKVAMMDAGLAWMFALVREATGSERAGARARRSS
ncbi:MAG: LysR family transcriptional regulator [Afipia sp.]